MNDYAKAHPEAVAQENRIVLPVTGVDVVGHPMRAVHYGYMASLRPHAARGERAFKRAAAPSTVAALAQRG